MAKTSWGLYFLQILQFEKTLTYKNDTWRNLRYVKSCGKDLGLMYLNKYYFVVTLISSTNFEVKTVQIAGGQHFAEVLLLSTKNLSFFEFRCIFKKAKGIGKIFRQSKKKIGDDLMENTFSADSII